MFHAEDLLLDHEKQLGPHTQVIIQPNSMAKVILYLTVAQYLRGRTTQGAQRLLWISGKSMGM